MDKYLVLRKTYTFLFGIQLQGSLRADFWYVVYITGREGIVNNDAITNMKICILRVKKRLKTEKKPQKHVTKYTCMHNKLKISKKTIQIIMTSTTPNEGSITRALCVLSVFAEHSPKFLKLIWIRVFTYIYEDPPNLLAATNGRTRVALICLAAQQSTTRVNCLRERRSLLMAAMISSAAFCTALNPYAYAPRKKFNNRLCELLIEWHQLIYATALRTIRFVEHMAFNTSFLRFSKSAAFDYNTKWHY